jgi:acyl-CoA reductase-like NAD-dependent aldehyde dehydrogenase
MKASGLGREGGDYSLEFFTENRDITFNALPPMARD